ncbi:MAG: DUF1343 domain-containing protein [Deltaproteobacteria bacterium]|nr:DUF1343 domain-containing protein [Deltaproteobacteria bacterium]
MIQTGLDRLGFEEARLVRGRKVALLANPASVDSSLRHARDVLVAAGAKIMALLGPEHGFGGAAQDMEGVADAPDPVTGAPIYSVYGDSFESLTPRDEMLAGADLLVIDLQDVGVRYYTFVWTAVLAMERAISRGKAILVLDRPNPLGGTIVEGAPQSRGFTSFVGLRPVAVRHGLTIGELLTGLAADANKSAFVHILEATGWNRSMQFKETELPWVLPSPNMPHISTARVYAGMCLLEATEVSEGRGTTRPFEIFGAPWLDGNRLAQLLAKDQLPGCAFRPLSFRPTFHKFAGQVCGGCQLHVLDTNAFKPFRTGVGVLRAIRKVHPDKFAWRAKPYEFVGDIPAIDLLTGSAEVRKGIEADASLDEIAGTWAPGEEEFRKARARWFRYGAPPPRRR